LIERFGLREGSDPQTYAIGVKELWEVEPSRHQPGLVVHTIGWPLDRGTYGGSFLYHLEDRQVAVGFVIGLDYKNPFLAPFEEFQRFKTHPAIRDFFRGRAAHILWRAGAQRGRVAVDPAARFSRRRPCWLRSRFVNVPKIKGSHTAMKSGMVAAETIFCPARGE